MFLRPFLHLPTSSCLDATMYACPADALQHPYDPYAHGGMRLNSGDRALLRPALPQDGPLALRFMRGLSPRTHWRRFHGRLPALGMVALASTDSMPHPPHQALVAVVREGGYERIVGDARFVRDSGGREAEFAVVVCDSMRRQGLGRALLLGLQQQAAESGVRWLRGDVHLDNPPMLALMLSLGFRPARCDEAAGLMVFEQRLLAPDA